MTSSLKNAYLANLQVCLPAVHTLTSFQYFIKISCTLKSFSLFIDGHIGGGGVMEVGGGLHEVGEVIPAVGGAVEMEVG